MTCVLCGKSFATSPSADVCQGCLFKNGHLFKYRPEAVEGLKQISQAEPNTYYSFQAIKDGDPVGELQVGRVYSYYGYLRFRGQNVDGWVNKPGRDNLKGFWKKIFI